ncbi:MAG: TadE/TadG family type IV pilus assembly protein [Paracoccaceae bacterium]
MTMQSHQPTLARICKRFTSETHGAVLVEFAIVMSLFFFLFFTVIDLGRLFSSVVFSQSGANLAIRTAVVPPPACDDVPDRHSRGTASAPRFGTSCSAVQNTCADELTISCAGGAANPTTAEIWLRIAPLMPNGTEIKHLQFTYTFDEELGFLGGPYTPMVTVEITPPPFVFISPLGALAGAAGAANPGSIGNAITYPSFSVSLPGEDLALGTAG